MSIAIYVRVSTQRQAEAQTIDVAGLDVWPGMIALGSTLGLSEVGSLRETQDFARFLGEEGLSEALADER